LADDDDAVRTAFCSLLRSFDFEIAGEVADGQTALAEAASLTPDVVLLDITMPRLSGLKALSALRNCVPSAIIIVLTSHESPVYRQEALRLGADGFVLKSRAVFDLIPAIEGAVAMQQMHTRQRE
jgi:DNA-binding NarL/FixJ family response regulator